MQLAKCVRADLQMWHPNPKLIGAVTSTDLHFTHGLVEIFNCLRYSSRVKQCTVWSYQIT